MAEQPSGVPPVAKMDWNEMHLMWLLTFVTMFDNNLNKVIRGFNLFSPIGSNAKPRGGQARGLHKGSSPISKCPLGSKKDEQVFLV